MAKRRGNQEGSIYRRPNGRWQAQITLDGKRLTQTLNTQKECRQWIKDMIAQIDNGLSFRGAFTTVEEFLQTWLTDIKSSLKPKTWHQYYGIVHNHIILALGDVKLKDLRPERIQSFYTTKLREGASERTVELIHSVLHRSLVIAQRYGFIGRNPADAVEKPRVTKKEMQVLDDNQVRLLLIVAKGNRNEALYHLAVTTGLRQGELLGLKWQDLDWADGVLQIRRQLQRIRGMGKIFSNPKTKAGRRSIQLEVEALKQLSAHKERQERECLLVGERWEDNNQIFPSTIGTPMEPRRLLHEYKKLLQAAGLPELRFHDLRHTAATLMLMNGVPLIVVSRRLGHSKPSVTLDIYGHNIRGMQREAAAIMDKLVTPTAADLQPQKEPTKK